jgi:hypothetical protein
MDIFNADFVALLSPLAHPHVLAVIYFLSALSIISIRTMPPLIRLSIALPMFLTMFIYTIFSDVIPAPYEQIVIVRLSQALVMAAIIINAIIYTIAKSRKII